MIHRLAERPPVLTMKDDCINGAIPMAAPHTLSADDVYALTAYIPGLNGSFLRKQFAESQNAQSRQFHMDRSQA